MKNNDLIQEEIKRAQQIWGYDKSKTIYEQGTGTITCYGCQNGQIVTNSNTFFNSNMYGGTVCGTSSQGGVSTTWYGNQNDPALANCTGTPTNTGTSCMTVMTQNCPNTTPGFGPGLLGNCATINGQPVTQADVGRVVQQVSPPAPAGWANVNQVISSVQPQTQNMPGNIVVDFTITSCPPTGNTGNTGTTTPTGTTGGVMSPTINFCSGGTHTPHYGVTLNGQNLTQGDIGKTIVWAPSAAQQWVTAHGTITSVAATTPGYGVGADSNEQACPNTGGPTGNTNYLVYGCQTGGTGAGVAAMTVVSQSPVTPSPNDGACINNPACPANTSSVIWWFYGDQTTPYQGGTYYNTLTNHCQGNTPNLFPGNWDPYLWWINFKSTLQGKPWYASGQNCQFLQNRITTWQNKLNSGVGIRQQNMLNVKISYLSSPWGLNTFGC